jgi:hypothetical protein
MAVVKTMPRYTTGSDRQVQWAAPASPTIPAGRAGAADHRKTTDNRGERRSADRAGQHPVPECSPRSSDYLDCLSHGVGQMHHGRSEALSVASGIGIEGREQSPMPSLSMIEGPSILLFGLKSL